MPRLQQAIQEALPNSELLANLTADEVMAVGCCNQAAVIGEPWDTVCQHLQVSVPAISKSSSVRVSLNERNNKINALYCFINNKLEMFTISVETKRRVKQRRCLALKRHSRLDFLFLSH
jgi:molecular chaperone DnaK (HSP70)